MWNASCRTCSRSARTASGMGSRCPASSAHTYQRSCAYQALARWLCTQSCTARLLTPRFSASASVVQKCAPPYVAMTSRPCSRQSGSPICPGCQYSQERGRAIRSSSASSDTKKRSRFALRLRLA